MDNIASGIANVPHVVAFERLAKNRFNSLDLSSITMLIIDTAPSEALFFLAEQFGVTGYKGWLLAETDSERRKLIKRGIVLNRHAGTLFAIEESIKAVGFEDPEIIEGVGLDYDGERVFDGTVNYSGGNWATFRVRLTIPSDKEISGDKITLLRRLIEAWKNKRSHLIDITFKIAFNDVVTYSEFIDLGEGNSDQLFPGIDYNGSATYSGVENYDKAPDMLSLRITNTQTGQIIIDEI